MGTPDITGGYIVAVGRLLNKKGTIYDYAHKCRKIKETSFAFLLHNIIRKSYVDINLGSGSGGSSGGGPSKSVGPVRDAASELLNVPVTPKTYVNR